jgi:hypothetical protein
MGTQCYREEYYMVRALILEGPINQALFRVISCALFHGLISKLVPRPMRLAAPDAAPPRVYSAGSLGGRIYRAA